MSRSPTLLLRLHSEVGEVATVGLVVDEEVDSVLVEASDQDSTSPAPLLPPRVTQWHI